MPDSARLEVHHINVSQGDAILIIIRDLDKVKALLGSTVPTSPMDYVPEAVRREKSLQGTVVSALLIDGGDDEFGGDVVKYLIRHGAASGKGYQSKLSVLVSHPHEDHMAGLRSIFKERIEPTRKGQKVQLVERMWPAYWYRESPSSETDPTSGTWHSLEDDLKGASTKGKTNSTKVVDIKRGGLNDKGKTTVINIGSIGVIPVDLFVIASGQGVWNENKQKIIGIDSVRKGTAKKKKGGKGKRRPRGKKLAVDQNDRSLVTMLQYGSFRYFLGGDIAGSGGAAGGNYGDNAVDMSKKKSYSQHANVEKEIGPALEAYFPRTKEFKAGVPKFRSPGYATLMKANHHASSSSCDVHLFATLQPLLFVVNSGVKTRSHGHPTQETINRAHFETSPDWELRGTGGKETPNTVDQIYVTEIASSYRSKPFTTDLSGGKILGDIVVRPTDQSVAACHSAVGENKTELKVQVYGTGELTARYSDKNSLRPIPTSDINKAGSTYPMGPWEHTDKH
ncbi:hypothetical protein [Yinghuangia soli]|uniref:Metallo-beta-lactamase domain-containing protein n=1 Tax=Yinghuangia soli TaxID=2908204 RepID=A0AA41TWH9_9ACTN|nr:hypothetical protein [Yinghuangia soli]MCF2525868.1 hypothetical protein [Yinghuangia soli]